MASAPRTTKRDALPDLRSGLAETRARILQTAADCFTRFGFARTRMDDVATGAGVSRALVYDYFSSKAKLLAAVQRVALDEWFTSYEAVVANSRSARDALAAWLSFCLTPSDRSQTRERPFRSPSAWRANRSCCWGRDAAGRANWMPMAR